MLGFKFISIICVLFCMYFFLFADDNNVQIPIKQFYSEQELDQYIQEHVDTEITLRKIRRYRSKRDEIVKDIRSKKQRCVSYAVSVLIASSMTVPMVLGSLVIVNALFPTQLVANMRAWCQLRNMMPMNLKNAFSSNNVTILHNANNQVAQTTYSDLKENTYGRALGFAAFVTGIFSMGAASLVDKYVQVRLFKIVPKKVWKQKSNYFLRFLIAGFSIIGTISADAKLNSRKIT